MAARPRFGVASPWRAGAGAPARQDMWVLEEKITIGESRNEPREQTGEAGTRCGKTREGRVTQLRSGSNSTAQLKLTHLSRNSPLKDPRLWLAVLLAASVLGCGSAPAPPAAITEQSGRTLLLPARFGWVSSEQPSGSLPSAIALGGKASGRVLLYFEFEELKESRRL